MTDTLPITEARAKLGALARRTAITRDRVCITDHGETLAVLISPAELLDLEERAATATYLLRKQSGTLEPCIPQARAHEMLFGTDDEP
ncbi:MAG TPA: type II toxin-antitoxin system Phd/YefM family antitoxin [Actinocrinis sp.]|jgi:prevent-host-death family protein